MTDAFILGYDSTKKNKKLQVLIQCVSTGLGMNCCYSIFYPNSVWCS